jgi:hypothetical protein
MVRVWAKTIGTCGHEGAVRSPSADGIRRCAACRKAYRNDQSCLKRNGSLVRKKFKLTNEAIISTLDLSLRAAAKKLNVSSGGVRFQRLKLGLVPICGSCKKPAAVLKTCHDGHVRCPICKKQHRIECFGREYTKLWHVGRYGITQDDYVKMLQAQGNRCAICGNENPNKRYRLHVDHDHRTNKVRQLLCSSCNPKLGVVEDSAFLERAAQYLVANGSALPAALAKAAADLVL